MQCEIKLCLVKSEKHYEKLLEIAKYIDDNNFSCTLSIINEIAYFDIESDSYQDLDEFEKDASQEILSILADNLS